MHETKLKDTETGRVAEDDGWFILNIADSSWARLPGRGVWTAFEPPGRFKQIGIGVHILWPGDTPGYYHAESDQEDFLVLSGECIVVVEGEERRMGPWDFFHSPAGTAHIAVGAGGGPCAIVMAGARTPGKSIEYLVDEAAARHGASV